MMSYLSLVPISARVHKRQSRMTRICIILAVFLVTSIFSLLEMWMDGQTTAMRSKHGDWHIALQNMTEDKAEQIIDGSDVKYSSWFDAVNADADSGYYISGKTAVLYGVEEAYTADIMDYPLEGSFPQTEKEVAVSADAKELLGGSIVLSTPAGDLSYTVSGFFEDDGEFNDIIDGVCVYMRRDAFDEVRELNGAEPASRFYIRFQSERGLKKAIADIKARYSLTTENVVENTAVLSLLGASSNESVNALYPLAISCFVIILITGVFMISGCMNSNVAQRTKFFGMLRCIEYPAEINGHAATVDLFSHGDTLLDSFKRSVISGDISKVYHKWGVLGVSALQTLVNLYLTLFIIGAITTATEWKSIHCEPAKKIFYVFTFPLFMLSYVPIVIHSLFVTPEWTHIDHTRTLDVQQICAGQYRDAV